MPCRAPAAALHYAVDFSRPRHSTAGTRHCMYELTSAVCQQPWAICPGSVSSDYHADFYDWRFGFFRLHADFHEGHGAVGGRQGHSMARARNGMCELAFTDSTWTSLNGRQFCVGYILFAWLDQVSSSPTPASVFVS